MGLLRLPKGLKIGVGRVVDLTVLYIMINRDDIIIITPLQRFGGTRVVRVVYK